MVVILLLEWLCTKLPSNHTKLPSNHTHRLVSGVHKGVPIWGSGGGYSVIGVVVY